MTPDLRQFASYEDAVADFALELPEHFNLAEVLASHTQPDRPALICVGGAPRLETMSFAALEEATARAGSALRELGVTRGSRVCVALSNTPEAAIIELATLRVGAIATAIRPTDPDEIRRHQLTLVQPDVIVCEPAAAKELAGIARDEARIVTASRGDWAAAWSGRVAPREEAVPSVARLLASGSPESGVERTSVMDPAFITFTSGSTGASKAVVLPHSSFLAALPAFQMFMNLAPEPGDIFFTSLGWATIGGFRTLAYPAWHYGVPVVAADGPLDASSVRDILTGLRVTGALVMPHVLRELRQLDDVLDYDWTALRVIAYSGEAISSDLHEWLERSLGVVVNPYYGASEIALVASTCRAWFDSKPWEVGRRVPGRELFIVDEESLTPVAPGTPGMLVVGRSDPGLSLGYMKVGDDTPRFDSSTATEHYFLTHDLGLVAPTGAIRYYGRSGQLIRGSKGISVPPSDVEDAVMSAGGIREAAALQTETEREGTVCVCVALADPASDGGSVAQSISAAVEAKFGDQVRISRVIFFEDLPKTPATKKINRRLAAERVRSGEPAPLQEIALAHPASSR